MRNDSDDEDPLSDREDVPEAARKLERRRERYAHRGLAFRIIWTTGGFLVTIAGLIMMVTPGPAMVLIPAGLVMLSFEFRWARRALNYALARALDFRHYTERLDPRTRLAAIIGAVVIAAAAIAAILWYWFFLRQ